jgi:hypothetical protein
MRHHALTGGLAVLWQVVLRIVADLHGGEPGPFALASIVGDPIRRKYMGRMLDGAGSRPVERVLELGPGLGAFSIEAARRMGRLRELGILQRCWKGSGAGPGSAAPESFKEERA